MTNQGTVVMEVSEKERQDLEARRAKEVVRQLQRTTADEVIADLRKGCKIGYSGFISNGPTSIVAESSKYVLRYFIPPLRLTITKTTGERVDVGSNLERVWKVAHKFYLEELLRLEKKEEDQ